MTPKHQMHSDGFFRRYENKLLILNNEFCTYLDIFIQPIQKEYTLNDKTHEFNSRHFDFPFQVFAASIKTMLTFEFGCCISFGAIMNPALTGNPYEPFNITSAQSSWLGK